MAKSKKDDRPAPSWEIVRAVRIEGGFATCVCGNKIKLQPDGPTLKSGKREFLPVLVGVICPKCGAEVRLDSDELSQTSAVLRKVLRAPTAKKPAH
jgi:hypothetical protein